MEPNSGHLNPYLKRVGEVRGLPAVVPRKRAKVGRQENRIFMEGLIMGSNTRNAVRRLIPIPKFNDYHPDPTPAALRWLVFTNKNGFDRCVVRRGRRVLIDEEEYFKWLAEQNNG